MCVCVATPWYGDTLWDTGFCYVYAPEWEPSTREGKRLCVDMWMSACRFVQTCSHVCRAARPAEVMYDSVPVHLTLTETHSLSQCCNSGVQRFMAFCRIDVKWNRNIKLILWALVLRYKVASYGFPTALINWKQSSHVFSQLWVAQSKCLQDWNKGF